MPYQDDIHFENEVRRIARARWPQAEYSGAAIINGRERDGVFETEDVIHYIEATTSKRSEKAREDTKKVFELMSQQQKNGSMKGAIGWVVTKDEPTADQREEVKKHGKQQVKILSFIQFQQSIVDVPAYFQLRERHFFGSVKDPITGDIKADIKYVPLDLMNIDDESTYDIEIISSGLRRGKSFVLLGDYGAGKSMTLRQVYYCLEKKHRSGDNPLFPVYINLREHSGQDDPAEVLERHARKIGFDKPSSLVKAWRAGFIIPILDGFDEITSLGISTAKNKMREARRRSLEAIRRLIEQTPLSVGVIIAGREHFFNNEVERSRALSLRRDTIILTLNEFSERQIRNYLSNVDSKSSIKIPDWMPRRPLLVGYIVSRGLLESLSEDKNNLDHIDGWDYLLERIFDREASINPALEGATLRKILERLATIARATPEGLGPITQQQIRDAFIQICETEPDDQANLLLQRLPGLGVYRNEEDSRVFVDVELSGICRAKDIYDFISNPYDMLQDEQWKNAIASAGNCAGNDAIIKVCRDIKRNNIDYKVLCEPIILHLNKINGMNTLKSDIAALFCSLPYHPMQQIIIEEGIYDDFSFSFDKSEEGLRNIIFKNCFFSFIEIDTNCTTNCLPIFNGCIILKVSGRAGEKDLPKNVFINDTEIESFSDSAYTQSSILSINLSKGEKILLTILRKLFIQSLGGRAESALIRGLELNDRQLIPEIVRLLHQKGFLTIVNKGDGIIVVPIRKELHRVRSILAAPSSSTEPVLIEAKRIGR